MFLLTVGMTLPIMLVTAISIPLSPSGASATRASISTNPFPSLGACQSRKASDYLLASTDFKGWTTSSIAETRGSPVVEPIVTEPVENHVLVRIRPTIAITGSLHNSILPWYEGSASSQSVIVNSTKINQSIETIAWFKNLNDQAAYFRQIAVVDESQLTVVGTTKIQVKYLRSSNLISAPNSIYIVSTTMPDAPKLVFYSLKFGSFVTTFAFYGGKKLDIGLTSQYVNLGLQRLFASCS